MTCGSHPANDLLITNPDRFDLRLNYTCQLVCNSSLPLCSHKCTQKCHQTDRQHKNFNCMKKCQKAISRCGHQCQLVCSHTEPCQICPIIVEKKIFECGHKVKLRCDIEPKRMNCPWPCELVLPCGHRCLKMCANECRECETVVDKKISECGHIIKAKCHKLVKRIECTHPCEKFLLCGHMCTKMCCDLECEPCQKQKLVTCEHGSKISIKCSASKDEITNAKTLVRKQCNICSSQCNIL